MSSNENVASKQKLVEDMYNRIGSWITEHRNSLVLIGIDANETRASSDRSSVNKKVEARHLGILIDTHSLLDVGERCGTHTFERAGASSRIDYMLCTRSVKEFKVLPNPSGHHDHKVLQAVILKDTTRERGISLLAEEKQNENTGGNCELPRITYINTSDMSETKRRLLTEGLVTHVQEMNKRLDGMNTEELVSALNTVVSALVSRHVMAPRAQKSDKKNIVKKKTMTEIPRKMRAVTRLNDHFRKHLPTAVSSGGLINTWKSDKGISLIQNVMCVGLSNIRKCAEQWSYRDAVEWYKDVPELKKILHKRKQEVVNNELGRSKRLGDLFHKDRARFYKKIFEKHNDTVTQLKHGEEYMRGERALRLIEEGISKTFSNEQMEPTTKPRWVEEMYRRRTDTTELFRSMEDKFTKEEITSAITTTGNGKAGLDLMTNDVLKCVIKTEQQRYRTEYIATHLTYILNRFLKEGSIPECLRRVVMKMIPKPGAKEMEVASLRPISIIPELCKLLGKVLATRLGTLLCSRPDVLHKSQRGFLRHGNTGQCIDVAIRVLEDHRRTRGDIHIASYDQKKAYDSVQHFSIRMALRHFGIPDAVATLIMSSLTGTTAHLSTDFGLSRPFPLLTSVKQGDPLAPLVFILTVDPLHRGLDKNPLYGGARDGYKIGREVSSTVSSTAYADDFTIASNSWTGLCRLHNWIVEFFRFHYLDLNPKKSFLTCKEASRTDPVTGITKQLPPVQGQDAIPWRSPNDAWRHLGIELTMNLDWSAQISKMSQIIGRYNHLSEINNLNALMRSSTVRECIVSRLDLGLTHAKVTEKQLDEWDRWIRSNILRRTKVLCPGSFSKAAFHIITNVPCLKHQMAARRLSELHIQLNSQEPPSSETLWALLSTQVGSADLETIVDSISGLTLRKDWIGSVSSAMKLLNMTLSFNCQTWDERDMKIETVHSPVQLRLWQKEHDEPHANKNELICTPIATTTTWEAFTDGSTPIHGAGPSGVGIYLTHPCYQKIEVAHPFKASGNNFAAEMMAILIALVLVPINHPLTIYTDSQAAIYAIERDKKPKSERDWMRTAARPIARSISIVLKHRTAPTSFQWIRSHSDSDSPTSKGNQIADRLANEGRIYGEKNPNRILDFIQNEERMIMYIEQTKMRRQQSNGDSPRTFTHIIGDVKEEAKRESTRQLMREWIEQPSQGLVATSNPTDTLELCRYIRSLNSNEILCCYLETLTQTGNTAKRRRTMLKDDAKSKQRQMNSSVMRLCPFCKLEEESTEHIFQCEKVMSIYATDIDRIKYEMDPHCLLDDEFQWITRRETEHSMVSAWQAIMKETGHEDKDNTIHNMILTVSNHSLFAGIVGVQPPHIKDLYMIYEEIAEKYRHENYEEQTKDSRMKQRRRDIEKRLEKIRYLCVRLTCKIWKHWHRLLMRRIRMFELGKNHTYARAIGIEVSNRVTFSRRKPKIWKKNSTDPKIIGRTTGPKATRRKMWDARSRTFVSCPRRR
jgi:ribonuclease HI